MHFAIVYSQDRYCERTNPSFAVGEIWTTLSYMESFPMLNQGTQQILMVKNYFQEKRQVEFQSPLKI